VFGVSSAVELQRSRLGWSAGALDHVLSPHTGSFHLYITGECFALPFSTKSSHFATALPLLLSPSFLSQNVPHQPHRVPLRRFASLFTNSDVLTERALASRMQDQYCTTRSNKRCRWPFLIGLRRTNAPTQDLRTHHQHRKEKRDASQRPSLKHSPGLCQFPQLSVEHPSHKKHSSIANLNSNQIGNSQAAIIFISQLHEPATQP